MLSVASSKYYYILIIFRSQAISENNQNTVIFTKKHTPPFGRGVERSDDYGCCKKQVYV